MITIIDETVILRYVLKDSPRQSQEAAEVIETGDAYTYPEILARVAVTLHDVYDVPRTIIARTLLLVLDDVHVQERDVVKLACRMYGNTRLDFTDCMMSARNTLHGYGYVSFAPRIRRGTLPPYAPVTD